MTAEIALMNPTAVALAADSVVSVGDNKEYQSVNKLFRLRINQPVGIMIYGNASFMGVPWELIIKEYRSENRSSHSKKRLADYATDFMKYVATDKRFITSEMEAHFALREIASYFHHVILSIEEEVNQFIRENGSIDDATVDALLSNHFKAREKHLKSLRNLTRTDRGYISRIASIVNSVIGDAVDLVFEDGIPKGITLALLKRIAVLVLSKEIRGASVGLVIAGFGDEDMYPVMTEVHPVIRVEGIIGYVKGRECGIDPFGSGSNALVIPCAQRQTVDAFIGGVDNEFSDEIVLSLGQVLEDYAEYAVKKLEKHSPELGSKDLVTIQKAFAKRSQELSERFDEILNKVRQERYASPILRAVNVLPKDELANMAESLVNLTSLRQRVSLTRETVGGPIDVAVISRGEGFVWIKKKHYFSEDLNRRFYHKPY